MMKKIDLNCDLGESYGKYVSVNDEDIMPYISSCNIACGFHSGDPATILKTIELASDHDVAIGAHPSYPDLQGFGRRVMNMTQKELEACILYQVSALKGMVESTGRRLHHVKPHGALYNHAAVNEEAALAIVEAVVAIDDTLLLFVPAQSVLRKVAEDSSLKVCTEVFADRSYDNNLNLRPRNQEGAVLHRKEEVLEQLRMIVTEGKVKTYEGLELPIQADTICLHSDTQGSAVLAKHIHEFLKSNNIEISPV